MSSPQVESSPALCQKLVPLINRRNARDRAGLVIKDFIRHMTRRAGRLGRAKTSPQVKGGQSDSALGQVP